MTVLLVVGCSKQEETSQPTAGGEAKSAKEEKKPQPPVEKSPEESQEQPKELPETSAQKSTEKQETQEPVEEKPATGIPAHFPAGKSALHSVAALKYVPADALFAVVVANPGALVELAGFDKLKDKYARYYLEGVKESLDITGRNVLDPAQMPEIGIDISRPALFAYTDYEGDAGAFIVSLSDGEKFKGFLRSVGTRRAKKLVEFREGDAEIIHPERDTDLCFVLRGNHLLFVFSGRSDEAGLAQARRLAALDTSASMAESKELREALERLAFGHEAAIYGNIPALIEEENKDQVRRMGEFRGYAAEQLKRLKAEKADPELLKEMEKRATEELEQHERFKKSLAREAKFWNALFGGISGAVAGGNFADGAFLAKGVALLGKENFLGRLIKPAAGAPVMPPMLDEPPVYLLEGTIDVPAVLGLLREHLRNEDGSDPVAQMLQALVGIDLESDLLPLLAGRLAFAFTADPEAIREGESEFVMGLGGTLLLAISDEARGRGLLDKLGKTPLFSSLGGWDDKLSAWVVAVPEWRKLYVGIAGGYLSISTDSGFLARITAPGKNPPAGVKDAAGQAMLSMPETSVLWLMNPAVFAYVFAARFDYDMGAYETKDDSPAPRSEAYKKAAEEFKKLQKQTAAMRRDFNAAEQRLVKAIMDRFGISVVVGRRTAVGVELFGGQFYRAESIHQLVDHTIGDAISLEGGGKGRQELWDLERKMWDLQSERDRIRQEDILKYEQNREKEDAKP